MTSTHKPEMKSVPLFMVIVKVAASKGCNVRLALVPRARLRVMRTTILKDWRPKAQSFDIEVELNRHVERRGFDVIEVPIRYRPRLGEKKLRVKDGFTILKRIMLGATEDLLVARTGRTELTIHGDMKINYCKTGRNENWRRF